MTDWLSYPVDGDHHLSDDWDDHIARGSLGGVDFPVAYGSPVYADHDGFLSIDNSPSGSGGRVATVQGGGITTQCLHMSSFVGNNRNVSRGELIGYSGASANGSNWGVGPHVHWHAIVDGIRVNPLLYLGTPTPPPAPPKPKLKNRKAIPMILMYINGIGCLIGANGNQIALNEYDFSLMKRAIYGRQYDGKTVDFEPDTFTNDESVRIGNLSRQANKF